jgi:N-acetylated-alpha-linked acidic dipeptidase
MRHTSTRFVLLSILLLGFCHLSTLAVVPTGSQGNFDGGLTQRERQFDQMLRADNIRDLMKRLAARPQHLGSPYRKENAEFIREKFQEWGFDARIETFEVLFPTPKARLLEMTEPVPFRASLEFSSLENGPAGVSRDEILPSYNAYSVDGDVTAPLVYVNYGTSEDYLELERLGVDVRGTIVIARYGGCFRGIKAKIAAEKGALGCILYPDPQSAGYVQGDVYPEGPFLPESDTERGSVLDISLAPGDPLTPGWGSTKGAKRIPRDKACTLTRIPTLPISYGDALPLFKALKGPVAPPGWRGGLPVTYHIGAGPAKVHLKVEFSWNMVPAHNVIARIQGGERPEEWIIRGNHADGWVAGAADPLSGLVSMMEEARVVGELMKTGWRPKRTILYCAWDAEEQGIIGSTEWVEAHADELSEKGVVYLNTDTSGRGFIGAGGSPVLEALLNQVAADVPDPQTGVSIVQRAQARRLARGEDTAAAEITLSPLGSGSDYTAFYQHLGIASLSFGFYGESPGGIGHSIFDTYEYYSRFGDPKFEYGVALAKVGGRLMLRLADASPLFFDFQRFAACLGLYLGELKEMAEKARRETEKENRYVKEGVYRLAADPLEKRTLPGIQEGVPDLDFRPLEAAAEKIKSNADLFSRAWEGLPSSPEKMALLDRLGLDKLIFRTERNLLRPEGLPRRPWFRNYFDAPGFYAGYGARTLPGIREAIESRDWPEAKEQIRLTAEVLERYAAGVEKAAAALAAAVD